MGRTIKFRVWDKPNECWSDLLHVITDDESLWHLDDGDGMAIKDDPEMYVVEQYTGLKDKNGEEIYEGDVIKRLSFIAGEKEYYTTCQVRWDSDECCFELHYLNGALFGDSLLDIDEEYEVIGNIHENYELLEEKKNEGE